MKILLDTSILVSIDRKDKKTIEILKVLQKTHDLYLNVITMAEILTGSNLRKDHKKAIKTAKNLFNQMKWIDVNASTAEKIGEINAYLIAHGQKIELPDIIIAGSCLVHNIDLILTFNLKHFLRIPALKYRTLTPYQLNVIIEKTDSANFTQIIKEFIDYIDEKNLKLDDYSSFFDQT